MKHSYGMSEAVYKPSLPIWTYGKEEVGRHGGKELYGERTVNRKISLRYFVYDGSKKVTSSEAEGSEG